MKKLSFWLVLLGFAASLTAAPAQDTATQQQLDKISGQIQDILDSQAQQNKRIDALETELAQLRDKVNTPVVNDYASREDLKNLADQLEQIDRKRKEDSEMIAKQIEALAKAPMVTPLPPPHSQPTASRPPENSGGDTKTPPVSDKGYYYLVKAGDTLGLIAKAYRDQGVKVTRAQIIAANPKMNPNVLIPGKKIFIPDASAK